VAVNAAALQETAYAGLVTRHFDQVTADWEMKMEIILGADGGLDFEQPDAIARFAREHGLRLFGHTLAWHEQKPSYFRGMLGDRPAFARAYARYIGAVVGRYRGLAIGWDAVNEAVAEDGEGLRGGYWSQALGRDYIDLAFGHARQADPAAVLFLNDYNLERMPAKRRTFLRLAEGLLKRGAPLGGLGTQCHLELEDDPRTIGASLRDLAGLGLPIHVSELDVRARPRAADLQAQARLVGATAEAFAALPARQRFAFTVWGVRDRDSWRRADDPTQQPLLFDDAGRAKPAFWAAADAWRGAR